MTREQHAELRVCQSAVSNALKDSGSEVLEQVLARTTYTGSVDAYIKDVIAVATEILRAKVDEEKAKATAMRARADALEAESARVLGILTWFMKVATPDTVQ